MEEFRPHFGKSFMDSTKKVERRSKLIPQDPFCYKQDQILPEGHFSTYSLIREKNIWWSEKRVIPYFQAPLTPFQTLVEF